MQLRALVCAASAFGALAVAACSGGGGGGAGSVAMPPAANQNTTMSTAARSSAAMESAAVSVLKTLVSEQTIGSARNPVTGDINPYGLDVAKVSAGKVMAGDLVICDFNDPQNVQGTGRSVVALHPVVGSQPISITGNHPLTGCNALVMAPNGALWAAAFSANDNPVFPQGGSVFLTALAQNPWRHPFGQAFVPPINVHSVPAFYVSNAGDGSLVRVYVNPGPSFKFSTIVTGFAINGGAPGSILGPSGLNYDPSHDRLYVVDGTNNTLYAIDNISKIPENGIAVHDKTFTGNFAIDAHVIFSGPPLNGPISSAILPGGNIAVGNTLDPMGQNLIVEISPSGQVLDVKNVDNGPGGALFGMVATGATAATAKLYFNDDNDNTLRVLSP